MTNEKIGSGKDLLLVLLYAPGDDGNFGGSIIGRTRLIKMVFLFKEELAPKKILKGKLSINDLPQFEAYKYGPFSSQLYSDLDFLIRFGFVDAAPSISNETYSEEVEELGVWQEEGLIDYEEYDNTYTTECFSLTDRGVRFCAQHYKDVFSDEQWRLVSEFKSRSARTSLRSLLEYVYRRYPKFARESLIAQDIIGTNHDR